MTLHINGKGELNDLLVIPKELNDEIRRVYTPIKRKEDLRRKLWETEYNKELKIAEKRISKILYLASYSEIKLLLQHERPIQIYEREFPYDRFKITLEYKESPYLRLDKGTFRDLDFKRYGLCSLLPDTEGLKDFNNKVTEEKFYEKIGNIANKRLKSK